jgi:phenylacetate-CoA ligase
LEPGQTIRRHEWSRVPLTTKDELRLLSPAQFQSEFVIARRDDIADYWRSGGVTGKPLFYPRTREDVLVSIETCRRSLDMLGIGSDNRVAMSFPLGIHPMGRVMLLALQAQAAAVVTPGAAASTPPDQQLEIIATLGVDTLMAMGTYAAEMAGVAATLGMDLASSSVRRIVSGADMILPGKRQRVERLWGAELFDLYGMSECGFMGAECPRHDGLHVWSDLFHLEVVDPQSCEPVKPGEVGLLVVTPLYTNNATPFLRWVSGDFVSLRTGRGCEAPYGHLPLMRLAGRTAGFIKVRGINLNHNELEEHLLAFDDVADYMITAVVEHEREVLRIDLELFPGASERDVVNQVRAEMTRAFEVEPDVRPVTAGSIAAQLAANIKQTRVFDRRAL